MNPLARLILERKLAEAGYKESPWYISPTKNPKIWRSKRFWLGLADDETPHVWRAYAQGRYLYRRLQSKARDQFIKRILEGGCDDPTD